TVVATILAGLSSSEMSLAQYHRSLAAQHQSKVGDQWAFFQAKRTREEGLENTAALLAGITGATPAGESSVAQLAQFGQRLRQAATEVRQSLPATATAPGGADSGAAAARFEGETAKSFGEADTVADEAKQLLASADTGEATKY